MKNFIYILTIGGLLWLFFNPRGIFAYNTLNNKIQKQKKRLEEYKRTEQEHMKKINELNEFLKQEDCKKNNTLDQYDKKYYQDLHERNILEKGTERVKF